MLNVGDATEFKYAIVDYCGGTGFILVSCCSYLSCSFCISSTSHRSYTVCIPYSINRYISSARCSYSPNFYYSCSILSLKR